MVEQSSFCGQYLSSPEHKHRSEGHPLASVFSPSKTATEGSKGVDRVTLLAANELTDAEAERIVQQKAKELAQEGKRIRLPPKWL